MSLLLLLLLPTICTYNVSSEIYSITMPEYKIYSPIANGNSCDCPQMSVMEKWDNIQWGKLYQPEKTKIKNNRCVATNCYTYGTYNLSKVSYILNNSLNSPSCPSGSDLRLYGKSIKNATITQKVYSYQAYSKKSFSYAIKNYNSHIENLSEFINNNIEDCFYENKKVFCYR